MIRLTLGMNADADALTRWNLILVLKAAPLVLDLRSLIFDVVIEQLRVIENTVVSTSKTKDQRPKTKI